MPMTWTDKTVYEKTDELNRQCIYLSDEKNTFNWAPLTRIQDEICLTSMPQNSEENLPNSWWNAAQQQNCNRPADEENPAAPSNESIQLGRSEDSLQGTSIPDPIAPTYSEPPPPEQPILPKARIISPVHEQASSHVSNHDDESYALPHHSSSSSAPRMIQKVENGRPSMENAFRRLRTMGSIGEAVEKLPALPPPGDLGLYGYPVNKDKKKQDKNYPKSNNYKMTRCLCCSTTFIFVLLGACGLTTLILALMERRVECQQISVSAIITDILLLLILGLEWIRMWLWREPVTAKRKMYGPAAARRATINSSGNGLPVMAANPGPVSNTTVGIPTSSLDDDVTGGFLNSGFRTNIYEVPLFVSAIFLVVLYLVFVLCITGTIITSAKTLTKCSPLAPSTLSFGTLLAVLIVLRMIMCGLSEACRAFCYSGVLSAKSEDVPMMAVNQLHMALPGLRRQINTTGLDAQITQPRSNWLINISSGSDSGQNLSIVQPMPARFAHDFA